MHRIAYQLVSSREEKGLSLVRQTLRLLREQGITPRTVLPEGADPLTEAEKCLFGTPGTIIDDISTMEPLPDEVWLFTDGLMGPVLPLDALAADEPGAWYLARGAGFYALTGKQALHTDVKNWLESGMTEDGFLSLGLDAAEKINTADLLPLSSAPMVDEPHRMLRDKSCPFVRHEIFHRPYDDVISVTLGHMAQAVYDDLTNRLRFDVGPLWTYLTGTCHQEDLFFNMKLQRVLSTSACNEAAVRSYLKDHTLALGMHLYYPDLFEQSYQYACSFPPETDVFITTSDEERKRKLEEVFADLPVRRVTIRVIGNRGRDVSALLIGMREVMNYDCVCFFHDKKVMQVSPRSIGEGFAFTTAENLLGNAKYVHNVIGLFRDEPHLGIAMPPPPNHGDYYFTMGTRWGMNWEITLNLYRSLGLTVPISPEKMPIAPLGTCFWFRGKAMEQLFAYPWSYEDFPPEPNNTDGTVLHAIERIYPFIAVEAGYFPIYLYSDRYAAIQFTHFRHYIRGYQQVLLKHGIMNKQPVMREMLADRLGPAQS